MLRPRPRELVPTPMGGSAPTAAITHVRIPSPGGRGPRGEPAPLGSDRTPHDGEPKEPREESGAPGYSVWVRAYGSDHPHPGYAPKGDSSEPAHACSDSLAQLRTPLCPPCGLTDPDPTRGPAPTAANTHTKRRDPEDVAFVASPRKCCGTPATRGEESSPIAGTRARPGGVGPRNMQRCTHERVRSPRGER